MSDVEAERIAFEKQSAIARTIPEGIKREVRQRCGFGCIFCGVPLFTYDHMDPFSEVQCHEASNLTLLCYNHHASKTSKRISSAQVVAKNRNPRNSNASETPAVDIAHFDHGLTAFKLGPQALKYDIHDGHYCPIIILDIFFALNFERQDTALLLNLGVFDEKGAKILEINKNEISVSTGVWDYELVGPILKIRSKPREIELEIALSPELVDVRKAKFRGNAGSLVDIDQRNLRVGDQIKTYTIADAPSEISFCLIVIPGYAEWAAVDKGGNAVSIPLSNFLFNVREQRTTKNSKEWLYVTNKLADTVNAVFRSLKTHDLHRKLISLYEELEIYHRANSGQLEVAYALSGLGLERFRSARSKSDRFLLDISIINLRECVAKYDGMIRLMQARVQKNLSAALIQKIAISGDRSFVAEARHMLTLAGEVYNNGKFALDEAEIKKLREDLDRLG